MPEHILDATGPVLVFGGPYSNFEATAAVLAEARRLHVPSDHIVCTGDLVAYCGSPCETIDVVRDSAIRVVMGNCDAQIADGAVDCGCGFTDGSQCDRLSAAWFAYAAARIDSARAAWLGTLPKHVEIRIGGTRLLVVHGSVSRINRFVFATTPTGTKRDELALTDADGIIGGHCGLPFTEIIDGRLWHNAGVVGMPANDGTPRVWYSLLRATPRGIDIEHHALTYDHAAAQAQMRAAVLPAEYHDALASGRWPNCDVLPETETSAQGAALSPVTVHWQPRADARTNALLWPDLTVMRAPSCADCAAR